MKNTQSKASRRSLLKYGAAISSAMLLPRLPKARAADAFTPPSHSPDDLKTVLTPLGAERAGNAAGTIPPWTGGYSTMPADFKPGDPRPQPFADEKPSFSITGANYQQYQDQLSAGQIELLTRNADFRLDVYPTHRTAIAPQWVYDYTYKNATSAQLTPDGNDITGAYGGTPFPIPTNGHQVMWNHNLAWQGTTITNAGHQWLITSDGSRVLESKVSAWLQYPYYFNGGENSFNGYYYQVIVDPTAPPYQAGGKILELFPVNTATQQIRTWIYLQGERRVRTAPELLHDTVDGNTGGLANWDEHAMFNGSLDQYDCDLIGKKEMYIPYNMNKAWAATADEQYTPKFHNPDVGRWELHRVWIVEMTLKPGARNADARRVMYVDEDSWWVMMADIYDASGSLWKFQQGVPAICGDVPVMSGGYSSIVYDFHSRQYGTDSGVDAENYPKTYIAVPPLPDSYFTPGQLAALAGAF